MKWMKTYAMKMCGTAENICNENVWNSSDDVIVHTIIWYNNLIGILYGKKKPRPGSAVFNTRNLDPVLIYFAIDLSIMSKEKLRFYT